MSNSSFIMSSIQLSNKIIEILEFMYREKVIRNQSGHPISDFKTVEDMRTSLHTKCDYNEKTQYFKAMKRRVWLFENMFMSNFCLFKQSDLKAKLKGTTLEELRQKLISSLLIFFVTIVSRFWWNCLLISFLSMSSFQGFRLRLNKKRYLAIHHQKINGRALK